MDITNSLVCWFGSFSFCSDRESGSVLFVIRKVDSLLSSILIWRDENGK